MPLIGTVSGSHTHLANGKSHIIAGSNVTISSGSGDSITIAASGGGGISFDGSTANGVLTFKDSDEATVESNLTFDGSTLSLTGDSSFNGAVVINEAGADKDFRVETNNKTHGFFVDAGNDQVLILSGGAAASYNEAAGADVNFYVSGTSNSKNSSTRGAAVFGGDVVVSGSLYGPTAVIGDSTVGFPQATALNVYANVSGDFAVKIDNDENAQGHILKLSTDGNGSGTSMLEMHDGDGDTLFKARADGRFGFGAAGVSSMGAGTFVVGIDGSHSADIAISKRLQHLGDSNTFMDFPQADSINFQAGGVEMLTMAEENDTGMVLFLSGGAATDPDVMSSNDVNFFVSGALDSKDTSVKGTAVFGGDLVVSGILYGGVDDETGNTFLELNAATTVISTKAGSENAETGSDTVFFVSGAIGLKDQTDTAAFGGDLVVSGAIYGGFDSEAGGTVLQLTSDNVTISSPEGVQDLAIGADTSLFVSGAAGSREGNTGGTAVFGGDVAVSGSFQNNLFGFMSADEISSNGATLDPSQTYHAIVNQTMGTIATTLGNATSQGQVAIITNVSTGGASTVAYTALDNSTVTKTLANGTKGLVLISVFNGSGFRWMPLGDVD